MIEKITPSRNENKYSKQKSVNFGTLERIVNNGLSGAVVYRNNTRFFREDLNWKTLIPNIIKRAKHVLSPKIYCYASSDGSEPYSVAMGLIKALGKKSEKFFPIIARDIDPEMVQLAKSRRVTITQANMGRIKRNVGEELADSFFKPIGTQTEQYIRIQDKSKTHSAFISMPVLKKWVQQDLKRAKKFFETHMAMVKPQEYRIDKKLAKCVDFGYGDIVKDAPKLKYEDSTIFFRNVWPYLPKESTEKITDAFQKGFKKSSVLVVGGFDLRKVYPHIREAFEKKVGLKENIKCPHLFEKC